MARPRKKDSVVHSGGHSQVAGGSHQNPGPDKTELPTRSGRRDRMPQCNLCGWITFDPPQFPGTVSDLPPEWAKLVRLGGRGEPTRLNLPLAQGGWWLETEMKLIYSQSKHTHTHTHTCTHTCTHTHTHTHTPTE